jgi:hypothetical protein
VVRRVRVGQVLAAGAAVAAMLAVPVAAGATEGASKYNAPGQHHNDVCANPAVSPLPLRYLSGAVTGFSLSSTVFSSGPCSNGQVRLDLHEVVPSPQGNLVFHRGGSGYYDSQNVKYGQLLVSQLQAPLPAPVPAGDGRGAACKTLLADQYKSSIQPIPSPMKYKSPAEAGGDNTGASYLHYGDPASQQGDRHDIHYSTLTWSWINVAGGGHNRVLLAPDQDIRLCDVKAIKRDSWDTAGNINGWVIARYVQTSVPGGAKLYGWMAWQHQYYGDALGVVDHFRR